MKEATYLLVKLTDEITDFVKAHSERYSLQGQKLTIQYDPDWPCRLCGKPVIEASTGGVDVCQWCDVGIER